MSNKPTPRHDHSGRLLRRSGVVMLALLTASTMATATDIAVAEPAGADTAKAAALGTPEAVTITLVTGDTVRYTTYGDGRVAATVDLGPGRQDVNYRVQTGKDGHHYAFPSDANQALAAGVLDKQLFDLTYLAENAYNDTRTPQVPVIVKYRQDITATGLATRATALDGAGKARALDSINAAAVPVVKKEAGQFWADITDPEAGLVKVWLDRKVTALDDVSNGQIGAPTAWQAGLTGDGVKLAIIDTGIDDTHPDLAGRVVSEANFIPAGRPGGGTTEAADGHGHGTHVASIIAGSGAASDGRYKGVAPDTDLAIAKGLDDAGNGYDSEIIGAMEWAAGPQDAAIISMSLGGGATDGTDPLSQAVNDLTERTGALFVIAAGNDGPGESTVAAPGAADAALTVGAVDSDDQLASFSSRGPRIGDFAVKPEITAPGVSIVAARAAGTRMGEPVDDRYTAASGTSMATPHVAAAAAILAQQHPDWTQAQLKTALIGNSADIGGTVFQHGAGRLDIGRGVTQRVTADSPSVNGLFHHPFTEQTLTRTITYSNAGTAPLDLDLDIAMTNIADGSQAPSGFATLDHDTLTVPAGGTASVTLTLEPTAGAVGVWTGRLRASSAAGDQVTVPVGARLGAKTSTLTVRIVGIPGQPIHPSGIGAVSAMLVNDNDPELSGADQAYVSWAWRKVAGPDTYELSMEVADGGVYFIEAQAADDGGRSGGNLAADNQDHFLYDPEFEVSGDTTLTFNLADTVPVRYNTERPSHPVVTNLVQGRVTASGRPANGAILLSYGTSIERNVRLTPTEPVTIGEFYYGIDSTQIAPQAIVELDGPRKATVYPFYSEEHYHAGISAQMPAFETDQRLRLVSAGRLGAGGDVRGKLVYLPAALQDEVIATVRAAMAGGAAGVITDSYLVGIPPTRYGEITIPVLFVNEAEGDRLAAAVNGGASQGVTVRAQLEAPYEYKLNEYVNDAIPESMTRNVRDRDLARIRTEYHADYPNVEGEHRPLPDVEEVNHNYNRWQTLSIKYPHGFVGRTAREELFSVTGPDVVWQRQYRFTDLSQGSASIRFVNSDRGFTEPFTAKEVWNELPVPVSSQMGPQIRPDFYRGGAMPCDNCRVGDILRLRSLDDIGFGQYADAGDASHLAQEGRPNLEDVHLYRLDANGDPTEMTPARDAYQLPFYTLPEEPTTFRATSVYRNQHPAVRYGKRVDTTWTFTTRRPSASTVLAPYTCLEEVLYGNDDPCAWVPTLMPSYDLGLSLGNTARSGRHEITVSARSGVGANADLAGAKVWISPDDGVTWRRASVRESRGNRYTATVDNPKPAGTTNGTVTLKFETWDGDGNRVEQIIHNAYGVTTR